MGAIVMGHFFSEKVAHWSGGRGGERRGQRPAPRADNGPGCGCVYYSCLDFFACREDFYAASLISLSGLAFAAASSAKIVARAGAVT